MKEYLIGFDVREMWTKFQDTWDLKRRDMFLLKQDILKPISVDKNVWNSVFELLNIEIPSNIGWRQGIWLDINIMRESVPSLIPEHYEYWEIGITQFLEEQVAERIGAPYLPVNPPSVADEWQLLGYDVAELGLLGGLSNAGYRYEMKSYAYTEFSRHLNHYHLFEDEKIAHHFSEWTQLRDSGHGSWYVTGMYKIPYS